MSGHKRISGALPTECNVCHGLGYSQHTAAEMSTVWNQELGAVVESRTVKQGSGCPKCLGTGQVSK